MGPVLHTLPLNLMHNSGPVAVNLVLGEIPQWELEIPPLAEVGLQKGVDILIVPWVGTLVGQMGDNP